MTLKNFDRGFEALVGPLAGLALLSVICHSCGASGGELPPPPSSKTVVIDGQKHECFETEEYRTVVKYIKVIAPGLEQENHELRLLIEAQADESHALAWQVRDLEEKAHLLELDRTATHTELDDIKLQAEIWKRRRSRDIVTHYIIHGVSLIAVVVLGGSLVAEKLDD